jgi:hypothetical protein
MGGWGPGSADWGQEPVTIFCEDVIELDIHVSVHHDRRK